MLNQHQLQIMFSTYRGFYDMYKSVQTTKEEERRYRDQVGYIPSLSRNSGKDDDRNCTQH